MRENDYIAIYTASYMNNMVLGQVLSTYSSYRKDYITDIGNTRPDDVDVTVTFTSTANVPSALNVNAAQWPLSVGTYRVALVQYSSNVLLAQSNELVVS